MNQLTEKHTNLPAQMQDMSAWGAPDITKDDITIPMILVMQYMSQKVKDSDAKFGEFRDTLNNKLLGDVSEPFDFIPFKIDKFWVEYKKVGNKKDYLQTVPITAANEKLPYEENDILRDRVMYVYGLLPDEVETGIPYVLPLRRTSLKAGKAIMTQMYVINRKAGKTPAAHVIKIGARKESGDEGDYAVVTSQVGRETTIEEQKAAFEWLQAVSSGGAKVDESSHSETLDANDLDTTGDY